MELTNQHIQFVVSEAGKPTAVIIDISAWKKIVQALEDAEDVTLAKDALAALDAVGGDFDKANMIPWSRVLKDLEQMDGTEK